MSVVSKLVISILCLSAAQAIAQISVIGVGAGPIGSQMNGDYITSHTKYCGSQLCTEALEWHTTGYKGAVVTVESPTLSPEEGQVKLFSCTGTSGAAEASWIKPGQEYIFRIYESDHCTRDVAYYDTQLDQLTVYGTHTGDPGHGNPGGNYGNLSSYKNFCYTDLCTFTLNWYSQWGSDTVLTVQIPGETPEKLMACEGSRGTAQASWIAPNKVYVFKVYEARNMCTAEIGNYMRPTAQHIIVERGMTPIR